MNGVLHQIATILRETYTEDGVRLWINSCNTNLDGERPLDLLGRGEDDRVLQEVERLSG